MAGFGSLASGIVNAAKNITTNFADDFGKNNIPNYQPINNNYGIGNSIANAASQVANQVAEQARKEAERIAIQNSAYNPTRDKGFSNMGNTKNGVSQATLANLFADASKDIGGVLGAMGNFTSDSISKGFEEQQKENKKRLSDAWNNYTADPWGISYSNIADYKANNKPEVSALPKADWTDNSSFNFAGPEGIGQARYADAIANADEQTKANLMSNYNKMTGASAAAMAAATGGLFAPALLGAEGTALNSGALNGLASDAANVAGSTSLPMGMQGILQTMTPFAVTVPTLAKEYAPLVAGSIAGLTGLGTSLGFGTADNQDVVQNSWNGRKLYKDDDPNTGADESKEYVWENSSNSGMAGWDGKTYINFDGTTSEGSGNVPATEFNRRQMERWRMEQLEKWGRDLGETGESYSDNSMARGRKYTQENNYVLPTFEELVRYDSNPDNINDTTGYEFIDPYLTYDYKSNAGFINPDTEITDENRSQVMRDASRKAMNRWIQNMNTYDYLDEMNAAQRRNLRTTDAFDSFNGSELSPKSYEEMRDNYVQSMIRDMYDDNGNFLTETRAAPQGLDQADRFYYYTNMGTGDYGDHKGAENWLNDLGSLMGANYAATLPSRENSGFTAFRMLAADPTFNNQNIAGSYGDAVDRLWTDLFEQELRDNGDQYGMLDKNGHLKRDKDGKLDIDTRSFINEYFSMPDNYLTIDDLMNVINYKQIGTDYNAIKDFVNFMEKAKPGWVPVTMDDTMAEMIFGSKDPVASLAQYITNSLAMQELESGLGGPIDNNGYIDLRDINSALRDVGDNIVIGNKKDNSIFSNTSVSDKRLRGNSMYPLGELENGVNYEGWTVPEGFSVDNRGNDNAGLYKADARDVDRLLQAMGNDYGYTRANSQDYQNYLDNLYGGFSAGELSGNAADNRGEIIYSPENPVMKNYIDQAINNPYEYNIYPYTWLY